MKVFNLMSRVVLVLSLVFLSGCVGKRLNHDMSDWVFNKMDSNQNEYIEIDEYVGASLNRFERLDRNDDGEVLSVELEENKRRGPMFRSMSTWFSEHDLNQDKVLFRDEVEEAAEQDFPRVDTDGDGKVTQLELNTNRKDKMFNLIDIDADGQVSREEFQSSKTKF